MLHFIICILRSERNSSKVLLDASINISNEIFSWTDYKKIDPPTGVSGAPTDNNIMIWNAVIFG